YGHPKQDLWIDARLAQMPAAVAIGVGGAFDFVAGVTPRAPRWMRRLGIEWLHRLVTQPWRWRRMLKLPVFVGMVFLKEHD
ncbi:MAG: WecB/TagA/CpsF family glycosyltransferase, partial [Caldilinea sp.]|nr:WecB/TagA/CpsF family glycosyltransferase [Caldilinea sp.]